MFGILARDLRLTPLDSFPPSPSPAPCLTPKRIFRRFNAAVKITAAGTLKSSRNLPPPLPQVQWRVGFSIRWGRRAFIRALVVKICARVWRFERRLNAGRLFSEGFQLGSGLDGKINIRCIFEVFEEGLVLFSFVACFFYYYEMEFVFSLMNVYCEIYYSVDTIDQWVVSKSSCKLILYVRFRIFLRTRHSVILRDIFHIPHVPIFHGFSISKYSSIRETKSKQFNSSLKFKNFLRTIKYGQLIDSQFRKMTRNSF